MDADGLSDAINSGVDAVDTSGDADASDNPLEGVTLIASGSPAPALMGDATVVVVSLATLESGGVATTFVGVGVGCGAGAGVLIATDAAGSATGFATGDGVAGVTVGAGAV